MRLIFFLEDSPNELRSLVDFLNRQLKDTEVLLVEARLYESAAGRVVVPWLFGYTEEARVAKLESKAEVGRMRTDRGELAFWEAVDGGTMSVEVKSAIHQLVTLCSGKPGSGNRWSWWVSAIFMVPAVMKTRGLFSIQRDGALHMYFGYWHEAKYPDVNADQQRVRQRFSEGVCEILGIAFTEQQLQNWPSIKSERWVGKVEALASMINELA